MATPRGGGGRGRGGAPALGPIREDTLGAPSGTAASASSPPPPGPASGAADSGTGGFRGIRQNQGGMAGRQLDLQERELDLESLGGLDDDQAARDEAEVQARNMREAAKRGQMAEEQKEKETGKAAGRDSSDTASVVTTEEEDEDDDDEEDEKGSTIYW